jgi:hypothetical protein
MSLVVYIYIYIYYVCLINASQAVCFSNLSCTLTTSIHGKVIKFFASQCDSRQFVFNVLSTQ